MSLELELRNAPAKPDEILRKIAKRFRFEIGIPRHTFEEKSQETEADMFFGHLKITARVSLKDAFYDEIPAYCYEYQGHILNDNQEIVFVKYMAYVVKSPRCFGSCGFSYKLQVIRDKDGIEIAPDWFPVRDK